MAKDDWRLRIELSEGNAPSLLERLGLVKDDADELAEELRESRLTVTNDDDTVFVYAATSLELERAKAIVQRELEELRASPQSIVSEHWLREEDRWDGGPPNDPDEEVLAEGYAPWEVRIRASDHGAARELADRLEAEGYGVVRRWDTVIAGCASREDAKALADRLHGEVEAGGELVWEALQGHPFTVVSPF
ncbi:MAG TPA: hypothetical protein VGU02_01015 [Gaiellaceae bacterium]|nr:hypothetical protein [Gaiellaceae bacterium]